MHTDALADIFAIDIKRHKIKIIGFFPFFGTHTRTYIHIYIFMVIRFVFIHTVFSRAASLAVLLVLLFPLKQTLSSHATPNLKMR